MSKIYPTVTLYYFPFFLYLIFPLFYFLRKTFVLKKNVPKKNITRTKLLHCIKKDEDKTETIHAGTDGSGNSGVYDRKNRYLLCQINETLTLFAKRHTKKYGSNIFPKEYSTFQFTQTENDKNSAGCACEPLTTFFFFIRLPFNVKSFRSKILCQKVGIVQFCCFFFLYFSWHRSKPSAP
jgi:hypothetical protein